MLHEVVLPSLTFCEQVCSYTPEQTPSALLLVLSALLSELRPVLECGNRSVLQQGLSERLCCWLADCQANDAAFHLLVLLAGRICLDRFAWQPNLEPNLEPNQRLFSHPHDTWQDCCIPEINSIVLLLDALLGQTIVCGWGGGKD